MMHAPLKTRSFFNLTFLDISLCFCEEPFVLLFEIRWKTEEGVTQILNGNMHKRISQCILSATYQSFLLDLKRRKIGVYNYCASIIMLYTMCAARPVVS